MGSRYTPSCRGGEALDFRQVEQPWLALPHSTQLEPQEHMTLLTWPRRLAVVLAFSAGVFGCSPAAAVAQPPTFTVGWSVYAGWNPYFYMQKSGVLKKWADKYGIVIKVQRFDYAASLDSFVAKNIDACTMTNMEALDMPAAVGCGLVGDYRGGLLKRQRSGADAQRCRAFSSCRRSA